MARTPRANVSATSGQGTSRLSYQKTRALTKGGSTPSVKGPGSFSSSPTGSRMYAKMGGDITTPPMNVSYGDTFDPTDVKDITLADPKRGPKNPPRGPGISGSPKGKKFK